MNRESYEQMNEREMAQAVSLLIDQFPQLTGRETRIRSILNPLALRIASNTRAYELLGIRTAEEMADVWRVSVRRARAIIANRHERFGVGRQIGKTWVLSAAEADGIEIDTSRRKGSAE